jgi:ribonuclease M5
MDRLKLSQAVIVEGKYDKIKLESVIDALILTTDGFRIYKDRERRALLQSLAKTRGLIVLTDSDAAGFQLRGHITGICGTEHVAHVFIPDVLGKEKRKRAPSAEGKLGVEGMDGGVLREAFRRAGILPDSAPPPADPITRVDLYEDGFTGGKDSATLRRALYARLGLPARLSTTAALELLNHMLTREEYRALAEEMVAGERGF